MKLKIVLSIIVFLVSCNKTETEFPRLDETLAGSISYTYRIDAEGKYNELAIEEFRTELTELDIIKLTNTEVSLNLDFYWADNNIKISIPKILVSGEPFKPIFDFTNTNGKVSYNGFNEVLTDISIKGWMKKDNTIRATPIRPQYVCDLDIDCMVNDKKLNIKILAARPM
ncbi:MAG: hypothetical protein LUH22_07985 [Bacteroides sp.]|nr:hypothetical protein [Bacteroides sp.]